MIWANWVLLGLYILLLAGPLRRGLLVRRWRFSLAFTLGLVIGVLVGLRVLVPGEPWFVPTALGVFVGLGFGVASQRFFDDLFGKEA